MQLLYWYYIPWDKEFLFSCYIVSIYFSLYILYNVFHIITIIFIRTTIFIRKIYWYYKIHWYSIMGFTMNSFRSHMKRHAPSEAVAAQPCSSGRWARRERGRTVYIHTRLDDLFVLMLRPLACACSPPRSPSTTRTAPRSAGELPRILTAWLLLRGIICPVCLFLAMYPDMRLRRQFLQQSCRGSSGSQQRGCFWEVSSVISFVFFLAIYHYCWLWCEQPGSPASEKYHLLLKSPVYVLTLCGKDPDFGW